MAAKDCAGAICRSAPLRESLRLGASTSAGAGPIGVRAGAASQAAPCRAFRPVHVVAGLREALHRGDAILFELRPRSACQRSPIALLHWGFFDRLGSLKLGFRELFSARIVGNLMDINENGSVMSFRRIDDREAKVSASAVQDGESRFLQ